MSDNQKASVGVVIQFLQLAHDADAHALVTQQDIADSENQHARARSQWWSAFRTTSSRSNFQPPTIDEAVARPST